jgi:hypothetical protein
MSQTDCRYSIYLLNTWHTSPSSENPHTSRLSPVPLKDGAARAQITFAYRFRNNVGLQACQTSSNQDSALFVSCSRMLSHLLGNNDNQLCCVLRLNDDQGNQGHWSQDQSALPSHLLDGQPPGCHSFISIVISAYMTATSLTCHLKCYCATGVSWPYCIHEISLTIAPRAASHLERRIVGMVSSIGGKPKDAVYFILKRCCHSKN